VSRTIILLLSKKSLKGLNKINFEFYNNFRRCCKALSKAMISVGVGFSHGL
jgi:hypothetical protein